MSIQTVTALLLRRWWLIAILPLAVLVTSLAMTSRAPFVATVQAIILIPGDTDIPGNAERPELMVLDDVPSLIRSRVFAEAVASRLRTTSPALNLNSDAVAQAVSGTRYSRRLSVRVRDDEERITMAIASAVASVLPETINRYLIATNAQPATVNIIDRPRSAERDTSSRALIVSIQTFVALLAGIGLALLAASLDDRLYTAAEVETAVGLPVLADARMPRAPTGWSFVDRFLRR